MQARIYGAAFPDVEQRVSAGQGGAGVDEPDSVLNRNVRNMRMPVQAYLGVLFHCGEHKIDQSAFYVPRVSVTGKNPDAVYLLYGFRREAAFGAFLLFW